VDGDDILVEIRRCVAAIGVGMSSMGAAGDGEGIQCIWAVGSSRGGWAARNGANGFLAEAREMEREGGCSRAHRGAEENRAGSRQLHRSGGDGQRSVTCEAGEVCGEADGWGPATVPRFQAGSNRVN
jgi:hypothetical protein